MNARHRKLQARKNRRLSLARASAVVAEAKPSMVLGQPLHIEAKAEAKPKRKTKTTTKQKSKTTTAGKKKATQKG